MAHGRCDVVRRRPVCRAGCGRSWIRRTETERCNVVTRQWVGDWRRLGHRVDAAERLATATFTVHVRNRRDRIRQARYMLMIRQLRSHRLQQWTSKHALTDRSSISFCRLESLTRGRTGHLSTRNLKNTVGLSAAVTYLQFQTQVFDHAFTWPRNVHS